MSSGRCFFVDDAFGVSKLLCLLVFETPGLKSKRYRLVSTLGRRLLFEIESFLCLWMAESIHWCKSPAVRGLLNGFFDLLYGTRTGVDL